MMTCAPNFSTLRAEAGGLKSAWATLCVLGQLVLQNEKHYLKVMQEQPEYAELKETCSAQLFS